MKTITIILFLALSGCASQKNTSFHKLPSALNDTYKIWKINDSLVNTIGGFSLLYSETRPDEIAIKNWENVLNGTSNMLLACHGKLLASGNSGFVVGTSIEGPTNGTLFVYDKDCYLVGSIDCQKVVKMKLIDLLNDGVKEIVTWEDHHYGTDTTRRTLNIYKIDKKYAPERVFQHDLVDATFTLGGPHGVNRELHYDIDIDSKMQQKQIIVTSDVGEVTVYSWNGKIYEAAKKITDNN